MARACVCHGCVMKLAASIVKGVGAVRVYLLSLQYYKIMRQAALPAHDPESFRERHCQPRQTGWSAD